MARRIGGGLCRLSFLLLLAAALGAVVTGRAEAETTCAATASSAATQGVYQRVEAGACTTGVIAFNATPPAVSDGHYVFVIPQYLRSYFDIRVVVASASDTVTSQSLSCGGTTVSNQGGSATSYTYRIDTPVTALSCSLVYNLASAGAVTVPVIATATGSGSSRRVGLGAMSFTPPGAGGGDTEAPDLVSITRSAPATSPSNADGVTWRLVFSEDVVNVDAAAFTVAGTATSPTVTAISGDTYDVSLSGLGSGSYTLGLSAAGLAGIEDAAGNTLSGGTPTGLNEAGHVIDRTAPGVTITAAQSSPSNAASLQITVAFSEAVTGFDAGDLTLGGGTAAGFSGGGASYTFDLTPLGDGQVTVDIAAGVASDAVGNGNTAAARLSVTSDRTAPGVSLATTASDPTNAATIPVTVTFTEPVTGLISTDFSVSGATISGFSGSGAGYTLDLAPTGDGLVTLDLASDSATDEAGNGNTAAARLSVTSDRTAPGVILATTASDPTNAATIPVTVTFTEPVTGLISTDFSVSGATISGFSGSGAIYTLNLGPTGDGLVTLDLASDSATDEAGNGNTAAARLSVTSDRTAPGVILATTASDPTNAATIPVTVTFTEPVTGLISTDFSVSGATISGFSGSGAGYTLDLAPTGDGLVTLDLTSDRTAPDVSLATAASDPTNAATIPVTVTFTEPVTGLISTDFSVSGATISGFSGSGASYTLDLAPTGDGLVTLDLTSGSAADAAGNANTSAAQLARNVDTAGPSVTLASTAPDPTDLAAIPVTVSFSEAVADFDAGDVTLTGATIAGFSGTGAAYAFDLIPSGDGAVSARLVAGVASDGAGNLSSGSNTLGFTSDRTAPDLDVIARSVPGAALTNADTLTWRVVFDEDVTGVTADDFTLTGPAANLVVTALGGGSFDVTAGGPALADFDGAVTLSASATISYTDLAGNIGSDGTPDVTDDAGYSLLNTGPSVQSVAPNCTISGADVACSVVLRLDRSGALGLAPADFTLSAGSVTGISTSGSDVTLSISGPSASEIFLSAAAGVFTDALGNGNLALAATRLHGPPPTVVITTTASDPTGLPDIPITVTFSDTVFLFDETDITVTGGALVNFAGVGTTYSFDLQPAGDGPLTVDVAADVAQDVHGVGNAAAVRFTIGSDTSRPAAGVSAPALAAQSFTFGIDFGEAVATLEPADFTISGGTVTGVTGGPAAYTVSVTASGAGDVSVSLPPDRVRDGAGNGNPATAPIVVGIDATAPVASFGAGPAGVVTGPYTLDVGFSELVSGLEIADFGVVNATLSALAPATGPASSYSVTVTPAGDGAVTVSLPGGAASDGVGNPSLAAPQHEASADITAPGVAITGLPAFVTGPVPLTISFSEEVTGFDLTDIVETGGTLSDFVVTSTGGSVIFTPTASGPVTLDIAGGAALDLAGNSSLAAPQVSAVADIDAPGVVSITRLAPASEATNATSLTWRVTFTEPVAGVSAAAFAVTPAASGTLSTSTASGGVVDVTLAVAAAPQDTAVDLSFAAGHGITDLAGNALVDVTPGGLAETRYLLDTTPPRLSTITRASPAEGLTNADTLTWTLGFDEPVTGLGPEDFAITGSTAGLSVTPTGPMSATLSASGGDLAGLDGDVTPTLSASPGITDLRGNALAGSDAGDATYTLDNTAPSLTLAATPAGPVDDRFTLSGTLSETLAPGSLGAGDFTLTNATAGTLDVSGTSVSLEVIPSAEGPVTVQLPAGVAADPAGNDNSASNVFSVSYIPPDLTAPRLVSITRSAPAAALSNADTLTWRVIFDEDVTGVAPADFSVTGGGAVGVSVSANSAQSYDVTATGGDLAALDGAVSLALAAGATILDLSDNPLVSTAPTGVNDAGYTLDNTPPGLTLSSATPDPFSGIMAVTGVFSEPVSGVAQGDLIVTNATVTGFSTTATGFTATLAALGDGAVSTRMGAGAGRDGAGNDSLASATLSRVFDGSGPGASLSAAPGGFVAAPFSMSVTFTEAGITGLTLGDFTTTNATLSALVADGAAQVFTFQVSPDSDGAFSVSLPGGVATDALGNFNTGSGTESGLADMTRPSVTLTPPPALVSGDFSTTITFSEDVTGLAPGDIEVTSGSLPPPVISGGPRVFSALFSPAVEGAVSFRVAAGAVLDQAGGVNAASAPVGTEIDLTAPSVVISGLSGALAGPVTASITFSEPVTGFEQSDLVAIKATLSDFAGSGASYTVRVTPTGDGDVTLNLPAGRAADLAGNLNDLADQAAAFADVTPPEVTITGLAGTITGPVAVGFTFTETVLGFDIGDVTPINGSLSDFTGSGASYSATFTPSSDGAVGLGIAAGAASDPIGNASLAATPATASADLSVPGVTLAGSPGLPGETYPLTITFTEPVSGLEIGDFVTSGAAISGLTGSDGDSVYGLSVTPAAAAHSVSLPGGAAEDGAGNLSAASTGFTNTPDGEAAVASFAGLPTPVEPGVPFVLTVTFSEPVSGFEMSDFTVENGALSGFSGSGGSYAVTVTPAAEGVFRLTLPADSARDASGQGNAAAQVSSAALSPEETSAEIAEFAETRARNLLQNQPGLTGFLIGPGPGGVFRADVTQGLGSFEFQSRGGGPVWMLLQGAASEDDLGRASYVLGVIGTHRRVRDHGIVGVMLQFDHALSESDAGTEISATGWLAGPYFATRIGDHPLYVEGRVLWGRSENALTTPGAPTDRFDGTRLLATLGVQGEMPAGRLTLRPSFGLAHVSDRQDAYTDALATPIPAQTIRLTEADFGMGFEMPVDVSRGALMLNWGLSGIWSHRDGDGGASAFVAEETSLRGRVDLGARYDSGTGLVARAGAFLDGLGSDDGYRAYGLELGLSLDF